MTLPPAFHVVADAVEGVEGVDAKAAMARDLCAWSIAALAAIEGSFRAADEVQAMADKVRFT